MTDEDNPNVYVEYYDSEWKSIIDDLINFTVTNGGVFSGCSASIKLNNKKGKYTSGATKIPMYSKMRIRGDVRDVIDTIFEGRLQKTMLDFKNVKDNTVMLSCTGYEKLLDYYAISYDYPKKRPQATFKQIINHMLAYPDSYIETGEGTGITLETDSGDITKVHDLEKISQCRLSEVIRDICERINYTGYMKDEGTKLVLKAVGTEPSNPAVTLEHPFIFIKSAVNIAELKNYIMPWGGIEGGIPTDDKLTEKTITNYPDSWKPTTPSECSVSDSEPPEKCLGDWSIEIHTLSHNVKADAKLDFSKVYPVGYFDLNETKLNDQNETVYRYTQLNVSVYPDREADVLAIIVIELVDTNGTRICHRSHSLELYRTHSWRQPYKKWSTVTPPVNPDVPIRNNEWDAFLSGSGWWYVSGSNFNWKIKELRIFDSSTTNVDYDLYVDKLIFQGGKEIDPVKYTSLIKKDASSITSYGHRTLAISESNLTSFANAQALAQYNLDVLKTPIQKVEVKKGAKIWVKPTQTVSLIVSEAEIDGTWRTIENKTEWTNKNLRTTFKVVPQYEPVSRKTFSMDELAWLFQKK